MISTKAKQLVEGLLKESTPQEHSFLILKKFIKDWSFKDLITLMVKAGGSQRSNDAWCDTVLDYQAIEKIVEKGEITKEEEKHTFSREGLRAFNDMLNVLEKKLKIKDYYSPELEKFVQKFVKEFPKKMQI